MANSRSRKSAPKRPASTRDQRAKSGTDSTPEEAAPAGPAEDADEVTEPTTAQASAIKPAASKASASKASAAKASAAKASAAKPSKSATKATAGSSGQRFGDGATAGSAGKVKSATKTGGTKAGAGATKFGAAKPGPGRSVGRGGRGGRTAPPVRVGQPKPWGMIAATVAVILFAGGAIGYAVYQANSTAPPATAADIGEITISDYTPGQEHVNTDVTYDESPAVGGPHDLIWADCDGAVYDQQIRSENAVHSMEHGAVWITYNPDDISGDDLSVLRGYVQDQAHIFLSPYADLPSPISLQSWNHQLFVNAVDDSRINDFIQTLRQNPAEYPEVGASCSQPAFLSDPVLEGEQSRAPQGGA